MRCQQRNLLGNGTSKWPESRESATWAACRICSRRSGPDFSPPLLVPAVRRDRVLSSGFCENSTSLQVNGRACLRLFSAEAMQVSAFICVMLHAEFSSQSKCSYDNAGKILLGLTLLCFCREVVCVRVHCVLGAPRSCTNHGQLEKMNRCCFPFACSYLVKQ